jgi:hypothetical protein
LLALLSHRILAPIMKITHSIVINKLVKKMRPISLWNKTILALLFAFVLMPLVSSPIEAARTCAGIGITGSITPKEFYEGDTDKVTIVVNSNGGMTPAKYQVQLFNSQTAVIERDLSEHKLLDNPNGSLAFEFTSDKALTNRNANAIDDNVYAYIYKQGDSSYYCYLDSYVIKKSNLTCSQRAIAYQERGGQLCHGVNNGCLDRNSPLTVRIDGLNKGPHPYEGWLRINVWKEGNIGVFTRTNVQTGAPGGVQYTHAYNVGKYTIVPESYWMGINFKGPCNGSEFSVRDTCPPDSCQIYDPANPPIGSSPDDPTTDKRYRVCAQINSDLTDHNGINLRENCVRCVGGTDDEEGREGIWTAIGCIKRNPSDIMSRFLSLGLMMAGGVTLLIILFASFELSTSQGDPKRITEAKDRLVAAVTAILFIIFSVTILQFIGTTTLRIPGFGG